MRKWTLLGSMLFVSGCAAAGDGGSPEVPPLLREAVEDAPWGRWTPEFPPSRASQGRGGR